MPLPLLTWSQTAYTFTGYTAPTDAQVIQALNTASSTLTKWRKISVDSTNWNYIEFGGQVGSASENARILVTVNPGAGTTASPDSAASAIWVGYAPDGGTLGTWNSATPYGANRFTKYWRCCATAIAESLYFVESEEVLAIFFRDDSLEQYYGMIAGAIFNPGTGDAESSGRVHGLSVSGSSYIATTFWSSETTFTGYSGSSGVAHIGIFRPTQPSTFENIKRPFSGVVDTTNTMTFSSGLETALPMFYCSNQTPRYFVGSLRQMLIGKDRINRDLVPGVGLVFSASGSTPSDAILFSNL